jgi:hypothetical protein
MGTSDTGDNVGMLREAIARRAALILSLPRPDGSLRHHKSRFLADAGDGVWVAAVGDEPGALDALIAAGEPAGVSFRSGEHRCSFVTRLLHREQDFRHAGGAVAADGDAPAAALLLGFPAEVRAVQRRKNFRVPVAGVPEFQVKLWTMSENANLRDRPVAGREILCEGRDVSVGGIGLTLRPGAGKLQNIASGDRVRVQLTLRGTVVLLEGRLRYPARAAQDAPVRAGVQFRTLDESRDDRQAASGLNRIVNELQREQIRRRKLGLATPLA